jgi:hypothetical protein
MALDDQKKDFIEGIGRDRWLWKTLMVPQIVFVLAGAVLLSFAAGYGLYISVEIFRESNQSETLEKLLPALTGGGSGALGFVVLKLVTKLGNLCREFMNGEKAFTSFLARARKAASWSEFTETIHDYGEENPPRGEVVR